MKQIDFNDPKTVRNWEERIARFEGYQLMKKKGWKFFRWRNPEGQYIGSNPPSYSKSIADLFLVLRKICEKKAFGYRFSGGWISGKWNESAKITGCGLSFIGNGDTPEQAIFTAICQYLRQYHPAVGEEQEEIERGAQ